MALLTEEDYFGLHPKYKAGMHRFIENGVIPGDFLTAVLSNDLFDAFGRMDGETSGNQLHDLVRWIYNVAPRPCWGSREAVMQWCQKRRALEASNAN